MVDMFPVAGSPNVGVGEVSDFSLDAGISSLEPEILEKALSVPRIEHESIPRRTDKARNTSRNGTPSSEASYKRQLVN